MKTRSGIVILLIAVVALLLWAAPVLASSQLNSYEQQLAKLINHERTSRGLASLGINDSLVGSARAHSSDMVQRKYFSHDSPAPNAETWSSRIVRYGYKRSGCRFWEAGEDLYKGKQLFGSPVAAVDAWMHSAGHRAVILTKVFRDMGVGAVQSGDSWYFTLDLGRRIVK